MLSELSAFLENKNICILNLADYPSLNKIMCVDILYVRFKWSKIKLQTAPLIPDSD